MSVQHPDAFLAGLFQQCPAEVAAAFRQMRLDLTTRPEAGAMLQRLAKDGQEQLAALMQIARETGQSDL